MLVPGRLGGALGGPFNAATPNGFSGGASPSAFDPGEPSRAGVEERESGGPDGGGMLALREAREAAAGGPSLAGAGPIGGIVAAATPPLVALGVGGPFGGGGVAAAGVAAAAPAFLFTHFLSSGSYTKEFSSPSLALMGLLGALSASDGSDFLSQPNQPVPPFLGASFAAVVQCQLHCLVKLGGSQGQI